jgi:hypothetical protein
MDRTRPPLLDRRGFLAIGAVSAAALAAGSAFMLSGSSPHYRALLPDGAAQGARVLSAKELAILAVLVDRLVPDEEGWVTARAAQTARRLDLELGFHGEKMQSDVKAALLLIEHGGLAHGRLERFTAAAPDEQDRRIAAMLTSSWQVERQAISALKVMVLFYYYTDPRTWPSIHYAGPQMPRRVPEASNLVS